MRDITAISMKGLNQARYEIEKAAERIASWPSGTEAKPADFPATPGVPQDTYTPSNQPDLAQDIVTVLEQKTVAEANLKMISQEMELEKTALDLLA
jgi:hypothetical protein